MVARVAILVVFLAVVLGTAPISHSRPPLTQPFDEFGVLRHCDLTARLDNFAIALQNAPRSTGYIFSYGPDVEGYGSGRSSLLLMKDYLVDARGLSERRIKPIYAGRNQVLKEPKTQLWIVPAGAAATQPVKYETNVETFKGLFTEDEIEDYLDLVGEDEVGPGIGYSTDAAVADMLHQQKKAIVYIVTYNGEDAVPGSARRLAASQVERLKRYNIDAGRIKTIFGGVRKNTTLQLWIMAPGDPPPVKDAGAEEPPRKNVNIASEADYTLADPDNQRAVFNRMLEVLRAQPVLKAYVIVTLEAKPPERAPDPEVDGEVADLPKLMQKWREELTTTHKIRPDRLIVVFKTAPPDEGGNLIDIWAIAPGQPFPNPDADAESDTDPSDVVQDPKRRR